jgi:hypothetical protein
MISWFVVLLFVAYVIVGQKLTLDAVRHLRNPRRTYFYTPLLSPEEFAPQGEFARRRAVRYWYGGAVVVGLTFFFAWLAQ